MQSLTQGLAGCDMVVEGSGFSVDAIVRDDDDECRGDVSISSSAAGKLEVQRWTCTSKA